MKKTVELSGFGGDYENMCQKMLWNGIKAVEENPEWAEKAFKQMHSFKNVYGLVNAEGPEAIELDHRIMNGVEDATGAMHHVVVANLAYIARNGRDKWLKTIEDEQPERIFEWDGTARSVPNQKR